METFAPVQGSTPIVETPIATGAVAANASVGRALIETVARNDERITGIQETMARLEGLITGMAERLTPGSEATTERNVPPNTAPATTERTVAETRTVSPAEVPPTSAGERWTRYREQRAPITNPNESTTSSSSDRRRRRDVQTSSSSSDKSTQTHDGARKRRTTATTSQTADDEKTPLHPAQTATRTSSPSPQLVQDIVARTLAALTQPYPPPSLSRSPPRQQSPPPLPPTETQTPALSRVEEKTRAPSEDKFRPVSEADREQAMIARTPPYPREKYHPPVEYSTRRELRGNPFEDLEKFTGRPSGQHPMRFLGDFERIAEYERLDDRARFHFLRLCVADRAREWWESQDFATYREARDDFVQQYWGPAEQRAFRDRANNGMYERSRAGGRTPAQYAQKFARDARYLDPPITEQELVDMLKTHFDIEIYDNAAAAGASTIKELCRALEQIERRGDYEARLAAKRRLRRYEEEERARMTERRREREEAPAASNTRRQSESLPVPPMRSSTPTRLDATTAQTTTTSYRPSWSYYPRRRSPSPAAAVRDTARSSSRTFYDNARAGRSPSAERRVAFREEERRDRNDESRPSRQEYSARRQSPSPVRRTTSTGGNERRGSPSVERRVPPRERERSPAVAARSSPPTSPPETRRPRSPSLRDNSARRESRDGSLVSTMRTNELIAEVSRTERDSSRASTPSEGSHRREQSMEFDELAKWPIVSVGVIARKNGERKDERVHELRALLDTGAMISAVTSEAVKECERHVTGERDAASKAFPRIKINKTNVKGAFNQRGVPINDKVQMTFELSNNAGERERYTFEFYIIDSMFIPMILGADFMARYGIAVACGTDRPILAQTSAPRITQPDLRSKSGASVAARDDNHITNDTGEMAGAASSKKTSKAAKPIAAKPIAANSTKSAEKATKIASTRRETPKVTAKETRQQRREERKINALATSKFATPSTPPPPQIKKGKNKKAKRSPPQPRERDASSSSSATDENTSNGGSEATSANTSAAIADDLERMLNEYGRLLDGSLGRVKNYRHRIEMRDDRPYKARTYPIPQKYMREARRQIAEMERLGVIERAATPYVNPLVAVRKPNGDVRICLDARAVNARMSNDHAQPPTIDEILSRVGQRRVFTKLDISKAYWQIPLEKESRKYTGFLFDNQSYVYKRLPFGVKTAGASFTRAIEQALKSAHEVRPNMIVYLDDVLIASDDEESHLRHLRAVLEALDTAGFRLNRDKCEFAREEINFLGHEISRENVRISDVTKRAILAFPRPKNRREVQQFLGLANWDRRFVPGLADLTAPLEELLRKNAKFAWDSRRDQAWREIRRRISAAESLFLIDPRLKYGVETDASTVGLGAKLYQYDAKDEQQRRYTVAYASRRLRGAETRYSVTELETLALVWCLKKWRVLLMGRKVRVSTDHKALQFVSSCVVTSQRIARWMAFLQEFDLQIHHVPGVANTAADALSRNPAARSRKEEDVTQTLDRIPNVTKEEEKIARSSLSSPAKRIDINAQSSSSDDDDQSETTKIERFYEWSREKGKKFAPRICMMADALDERKNAEFMREWLCDVQAAQATQRKPSREEEERAHAREDPTARYVDANNIVRVGRDDRVWIPEDRAWELVRRIHTYLAHFGTDKCVEFAKRYFAINNLDAIARDVAASCRVCLATKVYTRPTKGPQYYDLPRHPGKVTSLDVYGPLPRSHDGCAYALVYMDHFSKYVKIYPVRDQKLDTIMHVTERYYVPDVGRVPRAVLTDCGGQFLTNKWKQFAARMGFRAKRTTPYNPQSNPVERVMREIGRATRAYASEDHRRWDEILPRVEQVINATKHYSTGYAPAELEGRVKDLVIGPPEALKAPTRRRDQQRSPTREEMLADARDRLREAAIKRKRQSEKTGCATKYRPGDKVWIKSHRRSDARHRKNRKLFPLYEGPFVVESEVQPNAYALTTPSGGRIGFCNARQLRPHRVSAWRPDFVESDDEESDDAPSEDPNVSTSSESSRAESTRYYDDPPSSSLSPTDSEAEDIEYETRERERRRANRARIAATFALKRATPAITEESSPDWPSDAFLSTPSDKVLKDGDRQECRYSVEHGRESPLYSDDTVRLVYKVSRAKKSAGKDKREDEPPMSPQAGPSGVQPRRVTKRIRSSTDEENGSDNRRPPSDGAARFIKSRVIKRRRSE